MFGVSRPDPVLKITRAVDLAGTANQGRAFARVRTGALLSLQADMRTVFLDWPAAVPAEPYSRRSATARTRKRYPV